MPQMRSLFAAAAVTAALAGCDSLPSSLIDAPRPIDGPDVPTIQVDYGGTYETTGTWDLSRPFGPDGLGGVVADLMIDQIISLAGVPSSLEGEARAAIAERVRAPIVAYVNGAIPPGLLASSPTMVALDAILSDVTVEGELTLVPGGDPDRCTGTDVIDNVSVVHEGTTHVLDMPEISGGLVAITSSISGSATGASTIAIADHDVQLHYGELVAAVAREALGVDVFALGAQAYDGVGCPAVVDSFTSGTGFTITVAGQSFSVTDAQLESACESLKTMLEDKALGMFRRDAGLRMGGGIRFPNAGAVASEPSYDGVVTLFPVVQPQVTLTFGGTRAP